MGSYLSVNQRSSSSIIPQWHPDVTQAAAHLRPWHWLLMGCRAPGSHKPAFFLIWGWFLELWTQRERHNECCPCASAGDVLSEDCTGTEESLSSSGTEEFPRDALTEGRQLGRWWEGKGRRQGGGQNNSYLS